MDTYYRHFGIRIFSFLDASEILLSFLNNLSLLVFIGLSFVVVYAIPYVAVSRLNFEKADQFTNATEKRKKFFSLLNLLISLAMTCFAFYELIKMIVEGGIISVFIGIYIALGLGSLLLYKFLPTLLEKVKVQIDAVQLNTFLTLIIVCLFNYLTAIVDGEQVRRRLTNEIVSFETEGQIVSTNDSIVLVGLTSKYLFLKDIPDGVNYIYSKDEIRKLKIGRKPKIK